MRPGFAAALAAVSLGGCWIGDAIPELYDDRYERCRDQNAKIAWSDAQRFLEQNQPRAAIGRLKVCVGLSPRNVPYHIAYQDAAHGLPSVETDGKSAPAPETRAMREFYESMPDDGKSPLQPYFRARLQRLDQREAPAQQLLDVALKRDPQFYFANHEHGLIWWGIGRPHRAATYFRKAISTRSGFLESRLRLAECYAELWDWVRAVDQYRGYLEKKPDDLVALRAYVTLIIYRVDGYLPEARAALLRLMQAGSDDLSLQMDNAALSWKEGKLEIAINLYRHVLALDHGNARAALNLGNLHYEIGRGSKGLMRRDALTKSRIAYDYFRSLGTADDAFDWFDLNLATRARLRQIDHELGPARPRPGSITWKDL